MPASDKPLSGAGNLHLLDERRSAHASIRGYLYQTCLGVLRWLDLQPNEILLCEGDEDLDRFLLGGGAVSEQVKAYTGGLSITDRVVRDSLRNFLRSYVALRQRGEDRKFVFTTTAYEKHTKGLNFDLLEKWRNGNRTSKVLRSVRALVAAVKNDPKKKDIEEARTWLDKEAEGWKGFMEAVEWSFGAPDLDGIRQTIRSRLVVQAETRLLPGEVLLDRLIVRVLEAHIQEKPRDRTLTRKDLSDLIDAARTDIGTWAASPMAVRIRAVFDEVGQIKRLLHPNTDRLPPNASPGKLLTAAYEVISFDENGRREELDLLARWCNEDERRSVLLLTGEGGSGKTRLMIEWCRRLRHQGWHAGFLRKDRDEGEIDPVLEGSAPRLVVVDYAETRLGVVQPLLLKMGLASDGEGPKLRVVLLARRQADWWESLPRTDRPVEDLLLQSPKPQPITALLPTNPAQRQRSFDTAVQGFAWQLDRKAPADLHIPDLTRTEFGRALYLHMAALAALQGEQIETAEDALEQTLAHERRFWRRQVEDLTEAMEAAVAAVTLVGGTTTSSQAQVLLARALQPFALQPREVRTVQGVLRDLYYGSGERYLDPLQPDILGEQLIAEALAKDDGLLGRMLDGATPEEGSSILTVLTRLAQRHSDQRRWIKAGLHGRLEQLGETALEVAISTGDPLGMELAAELAGSSSIDVVLRIQERCDEERYQLSVPLREVAHIATERGLALLRERRTDLDETQQIEYARLANNLGFRLHNLGQREDALNATREAVEIYRELVQLRPDAFRSKLAISLNNLGNALSGLGQREDALNATREAVEIYRELAQLRPDAFRPDLAMSLNNLGNMLSDLGRREDALDATREAVEIRRELAQLRPDAFRPDLASSLNNLGNKLSNLGRREDALDATREAVEIGRELAQLRPDAFRPDLATSLNNLGAMLRDLGRREDALEAIREAVEIRRELAQLRPDAFRPDLASSLNNLGAMLSDLGRREDAFQAAEEAVRVLSPFFLRFPAAFVSRMSILVRNYFAHAESAGEELDEDLLTPIGEAFQFLSPSQDPEN
jgi:tetratricopeptide (TPR) repeat protein